jgi:hypothetical protein
MPVRVHLDRLLVERNMTMTELAERVGITLPNLSFSRTGRVRYGSRRWKPSAPPCSANPGTSSSTFRSNETPVRGPQTQVPHSGPG